MAGVRELAGERAHTLLIAVEQYQRGASSRQQPGRGAADANLARGQTGARDERDPARKPPCPRHDVRHCTATVNIFFDVDETIVAYDGSLRPHVREVFA